jgi:hypothetical protein
VSKTPEGKVKDDVKALLTEVGAYWYMVVPNGYSRAGVPDFLASYRGWFLGIETKAPGKRADTKPNQKRELAAIAASGALAIVVDDVEQLRATLNGLLFAYDRQQEISQVTHQPPGPEQGLGRYPDSAAFAVTGADRGSRTAPHRRVRHLAQPGARSAEPG